jgi:hypothetical protein
MADDYPKALKKKVVLLQLFRSYLVDANNETSIQDDNCTGL